MGIKIIKYKVSSNMYTDILTNYIRFNNEWKLLSEERVVELKQGIVRSGK
jgi:hypothetical protein